MKNLSKIILKFDVLLFFLSQAFEYFSPLNSFLQKILQKEAAQKFSFTIRRIKSKKQYQFSLQQDLQNFFFIILKHMTSQLQNHERKYRKITFEEREKLIFMVIQEKKRIADAARRLDINPSTARIIIQNYKQEGRIYEKKSDRMERRKKDGNKSQEKQKETPSTLQVKITPQISYINPISAFPQYPPLYFQWWPISY